MPQYQAADDRFNGAGCAHEMANHRFRGTARYFISAFTKYPFYGDCLRFIVMGCSCAMRIDVANICMRKACHFQRVAHAFSRRHRLRDGAQSYGTHRKLSQ